VARITFRIARLGLSKTPPPPIFQLRILCGKLHVLDTELKWTFTFRAPRFWDNIVLAAAANTGKTVRVFCSIVF
jgi:hypothetical protein